VSRNQGNRVPGRWSARRIRREGGGVAKVYHHRVRDGQPVVWSEDDAGRLRLLAPHDRPASPQAIAAEVLADAIGRRRAWPLSGGLAAAMATWGPRWDWPDGAVREWAAWAERGGPFGEGD
jgi:hypothetical protein